MSFKRGITKPASSKQGAGLSLSGFSFKQLEEDEDEEDLTAFTGKYEKLVEESQKLQKRTHERSPSTSSVSSTSSAPAEIRANDKTSVEGMAEGTKVPLKATSSLPSDVSSSPIRTAARAKLETSKELFSGLKGKITDKISKTIEEFSGESSSSPSPEKEKSKFLPLHRSNSFGPAEKETVSLLRSAVPSTETAPTITNKENAGVEGSTETSAPSLDGDTESLKDLSTSSSVKDISSSSSQRGRALPALTKEHNIGLHLSGPVEHHPLAKGEGDDDFEDVIEASEAVSQLKNGNGSGDDSSEFHDPHNGDRPENILVFEEHFTSEPLEDFTGYPGFTTTTQLKPRSKIKRLMKKNELKTSAVATMSGLHQTPDEDLSSLGEWTISKSAKETSKADKRSDAENKPKESESTSTLVLRQLSLESRALPYQKLIVVAVVLFAYLIVPLPSYVSGFIMGILLASIGWAFYMWLMEPPPPPEPFVLPPLEQEEPPLVPEMKITTEGEEYKYKGWMNELTDYNADDYHINKTHSVFVSLEGSNLRMQRPKNAIPKRAMWDEVLPKPQFIHQRHFDLAGSTVFLLPHGLVKKRIWSKKYPICVALSGVHKQLTEDFKLKHISSEPVLTDKKETVHAGKKEKDYGFEFVTEEKCNHNVLYLFARTGKEKEEWFKRFAAAAIGKPLGNHVLEMKRIVSHTKPSDQVMRHKREGSVDSVGSSSSLSDIPSETSHQRDSGGVDLLTFAHYMGRLMPAGSSSHASSPIHSSPSKDSVKNTSGKDGNKTSPGKDSEDTKVITPSGPIICDSQLYWVNALIGRCFFDFLRDKWWIGKVTEKLQRKLSKIHVPYFIEELQVTDIHMGYEIPAIRHAGKPYIDERGFWIDLDIVYSGGFQMTIETKMNLMKLKKSPHLSAHGGHSVDSEKSAITHSDEEDSAESSTDEEEEAPANSEDSASGGGTSKKLLRYLNKITQSKYFQQATEYKVIKRAMENVSNTPLTLTVTVNSLVGKLALNIPPPPSDRLWYGFRGNPHLRLSAKPQVGERAVTITHVTEWIEKKLAIEFQRVFVMPNMDDLVIPILVPGEVNGTTLSRSVSL